MKNRTVTIGELTIAVFLVSALLFITVYLVADTRDRVRALEAKVETLKGK